MPKGSQRIEYGTLWRTLRDRLLALQNAAMIRCSTEQDLENIKRAQGMFAAYGDAVNTMESLAAEARGDTPDDDEYDDDGNGAAPV